MYLCIKDAIPRNASKNCEQARENFFVGLPEKILGYRRKNTIKEEVLRKEIFFYILKVLN